MKTLLQEWESKKVCRRKQLEYLFGLLIHTCKIVGCSFLRRLLDLLHATNTRLDGESIIRLNRTCRADVARWKEFLEQWNGKAFLCPPACQLPYSTLDRKDSIQLRDTSSAKWLASVLPPLKETPQLGLCKNQASEQVHDSRIPARFEPEGCHYHLVVTQASYLAVPNVASCRTSKNYGVQFLCCSGDLVCSPVPLNLKPAVPVPRPTAPGSRHV